MSKFSVVLSNLKESIFPSFCVNCHTEDDLATSFLCQSCESNININKSDLCPGCGMLSKYSQFCQHCRGDFKLSGVLFASKFDSPMAELIHWFKYEKMLKIGDYLGQIVLESIKNTKLTDNLIISFVPLHWEKYLKRGFNQSEYLARIISKEFNIPLVLLLQRRRSTKPQMKLKRIKRLENLSGAFTIKNPQAICGKNVLLVDDVMTTGSTLDECAKVLKSAAANKVYGLVVARD